jgi:hypothetical protein
LTGPEEGDIFFYVFFHNTYDKDVFIMLYFLFAAAAKVNFTMMCMRDGSPPRVIGV